MSSVDIHELRAGASHLAHRAMLELRPACGSAEEMAARIDGVQRPQGYRLVAAFVPGDGDAAACAGFRPIESLAWGRAIYIDDLSSRAVYRGRGLAGALFDWVSDEARRLGCRELHLDSGVGPDRFDAHRLYLKKRMRIASHHFSIKL